MSCTAAIGELAAAIERGAAHEQLWHFGVTGAVALVVGVLSAYLAARYGRWGSKSADMDFFRANHQEILRQVTMTEKERAKVADEFDLLKQLRAESSDSKKIQREHAAIEARAQRDRLRDRMEQLFATSYDIEGSLHAAVTASVVDGKSGFTINDERARMELLCRVYFPLVLTEKNTLVLAVGQCHKWMLRMARATLMANRRRDLHYRSVRDKAGADIQRELSDSISAAQKAADENYEDVDQFVLSVGAAADALRDALLERYLQSLQAPPEEA